jgi:2-(1,2-epoxy-1,2-dihydrophenyl)acetyl-CoA isomerase
VRSRRFQAAYISRAKSKPLLRNAADLSWEAAIAMEEFAEPQCFTTPAHRQGVEELLARK